MNPVSLTCSAMLAVCATLWTVPLPQNGPEDICDPATATADPSAGCTYALTGCICTTSGAATITQYGYCEGCKFVITGTISCTWPNKPGLINHLYCNTRVDCEGASTCGANCPCTGAPYYPFALSCGPCVDN